jgi:hypothetical protein
MSSSVLEQPMPFRVLIDEAMKLTRRHIRAIYPSVGIPISILYCGLPVLQLYWMRNVQSLKQGDAPLATIFSGCLAFAVFVFFLAAVHTLAQVATVAAGVDVLEGRSIDMKKSWTFVFQPQILGTLLLWWFLLVISFLLLVIPGIYVALLLSLLAPVMVAERLSGFAAIRRSAQLTRYNPQRRFLDNPKVKISGLFLIAGVISATAGWLVQLPLSIAQNVMLFRGVAEGKSPDPTELLSKTIWFQIPSQFLGSLVSMAVAIYTSFGLVLLYLDVRRRKEGFDLEAAIERMATGTPPPATVGPA